MSYLATLTRQQHARKIVAACRAQQVTADVARTMNMSQWQTAAAMAGANVDDAVIAHVLDMLAHEDSLAPSPTTHRPESTQNSGFPRMHTEHTRAVTPPPVDAVLAVLRTYHVGYFLALELDVADWAAVAYRAKLEVISDDLKAEVLEQMHIAQFGRRSA